MSFRLVGIGGNLRRPSRTRALVEHVGTQAARHRDVSFELYDLIDAGPGLGAAFTREELSPAALVLVEAIESADALIVGTPVYKGSYTGLFKHLFDFVELTALANKPIALTATGGGQKHALVVEHQLRPLFGFFTALALPTAVYAADQDFVDYRLTNPVVIERAAAAVGQLGAAIDSRLAALRPPAGAAELQPSWPVSVSHVARPL